MLEYIRKLWKIVDLRNKILYTFGMLLLFRLVGCIPAPGIDLTRLGMGGNNLPLLDMMNMMTGGAMSQMTIMAMGISPYINSSIIMQLLCIALPVLERMQQDEATILSPASAKAVTVSKIDDIPEETAKAPTAL